MCIANDFVSGLLGLRGFVGVSYVMISAEKCVRTCVSGNGPTCGE